MVFDRLIDFGILSIEDYNKYVSILEKEPFSIILSNNASFICTFPLHVNEDSKGHLHSLEKPSVIWNDSHGNNYFIEGIAFTKDLWEKIVNKKMSCREILLIENIEHRQIALKIKGIYQIA